eukprot:1161857-Pelagomonas_calceolata.AAC.4
MLGKEEGEGYSQLDCQLNYGWGAWIGMLAMLLYLVEAQGGKASTINGLGGIGDICLTCYGSLSRNRSVGVRLGQGEQLQDILASSSQVAEGVATAAVVVLLARRFRVSLPVLTGIAQILEGNISCEQSPPDSEAVNEIMGLPQIQGEA